jgi:hypothetical protein
LWPPGRARHQAGGSCSRAQRFPEAPRPTCSASKLQMPYGPSTLRFSVARSWPDTANRLATMDATARGAVAGAGAGAAAPSVQRHCKACSRHACGAAAAAGAAMPPPARRPALTERGRAILLVAGAARVILIHNLKLSQPVEKLPFDGVEGQAGVRGRVWRRRVCLRRVRQQQLRLCRQTIHAHLSIA